MKTIKFLGCAGFILLLFACGTKRRTITESSRKPVPVRQKEIKREVAVRPEVSQPKPPPLPATSYASKVQNYIATYSQTAQNEMKVYGIPASITLAQGILESGAGYGELTSRANNHFGIKCHNWEGPRVYHDDDRSQECFRKYKDPSESFRDHSLFLKNRKRYAKLFTYKKDDYRSWAKGLKAAGYATDPKYPNKLISIIERYGLSSYDNIDNRNNIASAPKPVKEIIDVVSDKTNKVPVTEVPVVSTNKEVYTVQKGDTLYSIAKRYQVAIEVLKSINNLADNTISIGQVLKLKKGEDEFDEF